MPGAAKRIYWDSCCFLDYVNGDPAKLPMLDALLELSRTDQIRIVTSTLSIVEVAYGALEQKRGRLTAEVEAQIDALWEDNATIELVEFYGGIAFRARSLIRAGVLEGWRLGGADAIHLATAETLRAAEFHTYDTRLAKYAELDRRARSSTLRVIGAPAVTTRTHGDQPQVRAV